MNLSLIRSMTRSAVFELENGKCFRPEHPFAVALNGKTIYESCNTGGYKDWCIEHFNIPSFTIEVGSDKFSHPFPYSEFEKILYQNDDIPRRLLNTVAREDRIQKRRVLPDEDVREGRESER